MDRIEMNGVWYVKETPTQKIEWDPTCFSGRVYESDLYCFEATQILKDDGTPYKKVVVILKSPINEKNLGK
jgi:hypothetical protein